MKDDIKKYSHLLTQLDVVTQRSLGNNRVEMTIVHDLNDPKDAEHYTATHKIAAGLSAQLPSSLDEKPLSEAIDKFLVEKSTSCKSRTMREINSVLSILPEILSPEILLSSIGPQQANAIKDALYLLPRNRSAQKRFKDLSVRELLKLKLPRAECLSGRSISKYVTWYSTFFNWAIRQHHTPINPFSGISPSSTKKSSRPRFQRGELQQLLLSPNFQREKDKDPARYWVPLIGLYTGARLAEITSLFTESISDINGTWVIDFQASQLPEGFKTDFSEKRLPIHQELIELGFLEYVFYCRAMKIKRLFPTLEVTENGYGTKVSSWFNRLCKKPKLTKGLCFHSLRHTVVDELMQNGIQEALVAGIVGHKHGTITFGLYAKKYPLKNLIEAMDTLNWRAEVGLN